MIELNISSLIGNYIKDNLDSDQITIPYIKSANQLANIMTHFVASGSLYTSLSKLGMSDIYAPTCGGELTYKSIYI